MLIKRVQSKRSANERRGVVLLCVLVVLVVLTLSAYHFHAMMTGEYKAADSSLRQVQVRAFADSGIDYAAALLSSPTAFANTLNSNPFNNPSAFQNIIVKPADHPRFR